MIDAVIAELRGLSATERLTRINELLDTASWTAEERGWLLFWRASSLRALGRVPEAVSTIGEALAPAGELSSALKSGLTLLRAVIAADLADYVAAEADLAEVERLGVREKDRAEYYGVKARLHHHLGLSDAFDLFDAAYMAFLADGILDGAMAICTQAARRALDSGDVSKGELWVNRIEPLTGHWRGYRDALGADLALQLGRLDKASDRVDMVATNPDADTHSQARGHFVHAQLYLRTNISVAAVLAERAMTAAMAEPTGYEPTLVERIRSLIDRCREVS